MKPINEDAMDPTGDRPIIELTERFGAAVRAEIARSKRYGHPFAVFILRPPAGSAFSESLALNHASENLSALLTSGLVRECDIVSVLDEERAIGVLLPETGISGAGALSERLLTAISDSEHRWDVELFIYPEHLTEITNISKRAA